MVSRRKIAVFAYGQSNLASRIQATPSSNQQLLPYLSGPISKTKICIGESVENLEWGVNHNEENDNPEIELLEYVSPIEPFAWHLHQRLNLDVLGISKKSIGATSIYGDWGIEGEYLQDFINRCNLLKASDDFDEFHLLNMHGEHDALDFVPLSNSENYGYKMQETIREIEANTGVKFKTISIVKVADGIKNRVQLRLDNIRAELDRIAALDPRIKFIDANNVEMGSDNVHYSAQGAINIGIEFAKIVAN